MDNQEFRPGIDRVLYTKAVYGEEEIAAVAKALREGWLGNGKYTEEFEQKTAELYGKKYGLFVNSGTSANMLAMEIAKLPKGSEVITQACTFPATLSPIVQQGFIPVFVDSKIGSYNIDLDQIEPAISENTKAVFISHALGNVNHMRRLREICDKYKLLFIEHACDTIGCKFAGRPTGEYSDITTASFYAAHNITAGGGGGMVMASDPKLILEARMLNDWGRAMPTSADENLGERFAGKLADTDFDAKFTFIKQTYNFKAVEMQAAFGLEQLKKLPQFNARRARTFRRLYDFFDQHREHFLLPEILPQAEVYLIAFPVTIKPESPINRKELMLFLEENKIQTRPLFAGNILRHPAFKNITKRVHGQMVNSDLVMKYSFLIGCHHGMTDSMLDYMLVIFEKFLKMMETRKTQKIFEQVELIDLRDDIP